MELNGIVSAINNESAIHSDILVSVNDFKNLPVRPFRAFPQAGIEMPKQALADTAFRTV
jgi:hypothetical protein